MEDPTCLLGVPPGTCCFPGSSASDCSPQSVPAQAAVSLPTGGVVENVDFERHLMGLFGRMGCNAGACHGSFQGKGGFRLSLFGYDPEKDYETLTREVLARRINPVDPDRSLLLLKATGQVEHGGGRRFAKDSWQYQLFREWIAAGAPWHKGSGDVSSITISPPEYAFHPGRRDGPARRPRPLRRRLDGRHHAALRLPHQ